VGDIVCLQSYRSSRGADMAVTVLAATGNSALAGGVARARRGMASGLRQMRMASLLLAEASAELRDLARWDAEQTAAEAAQLPPDRPSA
jgi:hypothetical protein